MFTLSRSGFTVVAGQTVFLFSLYFGGRILSHTQVLVLGGASGGHLDVLLASGCGRFIKRTCEKSLQQRAAEEAGRRWCMVPEGDEQMITLSIVFFLFAQIVKLCKMCVG